ncbi:MAG: PAS domain S-box protein [Haloarculaceae archaeon]
MDGALYRKLVEESTDIATIVDTEGTITYVSPAVQHTLGYEPEELIGEVGFEYQHPDDREVTAAAIERLMDTPEEEQVVETRFRRADGSWCWIEATMQNRFDDETIGGILINSRDISKRKKKEQNYRALAEEYRTLLDNAEDAIFFLAVESAGTDPEFRFERLSPSYEAQTGITTEEVRGKTPREVFGDDTGAELEANYLRCVRAREPIRYQEELTLEEGVRIWQTVLAPVITGGDVTRIIGITREITERVTRERQLQSQRDQLEEFAGVVSHDIRNPLNVAQGRATLLADECDSENLPPIRDALDRMEEIVTDTLTLARQGQVVAETDPIPLTNLVGKCWQTASTGSGTIEVVDDITIHGDRGRLRHVFENLFRNALEHGSPDVTVRVGRTERGIYVEDDGPGIPADARESIFEPGHTSTTDETGLGLTIVNRIAEAHGWDVAITAGTEGGARFEFTGVDVDQR